MISRLQVTTSSRPKEKPEVAGVEFGSVFSDHMLLARYEAGRWQDARIVPYGPLSLDPSTAALHYGQAVFEGLKAFRGVDGRVRLFRPKMHLRRLTQSALRLCIPPLDEAEALQGLVELVRLDQDWAPDGDGTSLYIRPAIIACDPKIGVRPSGSYLFFTIAAPAGAYYYGALSPLRIRVEDEYVRAAEGGLGGAKTGANYAAGLLAADGAQAQGFTQVLWLDARERRFIEEMGTMNVMLRFGEEVVTPPLGGSILAGVVRDTALTLMREWGLRVSERPVAIDEVVEAGRRGELREAWGTGTAAGITPISELSYRGESISIASAPGEVARRLHEAISSVQYGRVADEHGWTMVV